MFPPSKAEWLQLRQLRRLAGYPYSARKDKPETRLELLREMDELTEPTRGDDGVIYPSPIARHNLKAASQYRSVVRPQHRTKGKRPKRKT